MGNMRIQKRLTTSFLIVGVILSIAGIFAAIASAIMGNKYSNAMREFGFTQGDVGRMMVDFADMRSDTRGLLAFDDPDMLSAVKADYNTTRASFEEAMAQVKSVLTIDEERTLFAQIETSVAKYIEIETRIHQLEESGEFVEAQKLAQEELLPAYNEASELMEGLMDIETTQGNRLDNILNTVLYILIAAVIILVVTGMFIAVRMGVSVAKGIAEPLVALADRFDRFSKGDLESAFPDYRGADEVGDMVKSGKEMSRVLCAVIADMGQALAGMANGDWTVTFKNPQDFVGELEPVKTSMQRTKDKMNEALHNIADVSEQVSTGAGGLADAAQSLAEGATDQAGAVEELQATIANITEAVNHTAEKTKESYDQAQEYSEKADTGRSEMEKLMEVMGSISETSQQIGNIISEIEDIASQTNLLSLNASIEAARAGEAGKGFAVVADQIGKLADQSGKSAVDTRRLIEGILVEIENGNNVAGHAAGTIAEVVEGVNQIAETVSGLAQISSEQAESMGQVEIGINQISEIVQSNSAAAEELSATSEEMLAQAETMINLEKQFILE